ncbi:MAG TPA: multiheme c-type cytochrome [Candidatus Polarisedimenticolia bacterium]|nr:multiheme c-type cytochrome [Candidatus Polarisedimenticolia bacterium]
MDRRRGSLVVLVAAALAAWGLPPGGPAAQSQTGRTPDHTGSGSCSSSHCHGSLRPRTDQRIPQDEHTVWVTKDEHAQAYAHLLGERSRTIARNLGLPGSPEKEPRCLDCHALNVPEERRGRTFDLADGVSCESCHGPAEDWLGPHTTRGWSHEQSLALGMIDTKDPLVRAETCSRCHVGGDGRVVDHQLYAAGHPELVFEMQWASASMPRHWKEPRDRGTAFPARLWAVGQAVHLRDQMRRAAAARPSDGWPESAERDCGSCHHDLMHKSWRQERGYRGRPGDPPVDLARWRVLAPLARQAAPETAAAMEAAAAELAQGRADIAEAASRMASSAAELVKRLASPAADLGEEAARRLMSALAADPAPAREFGYRGAGQIAMSLDALAASSPRAPVDEAIDRLFGTLQDPIRYDPDAFARALADVARALDGRDAPR